MRELSISKYIAIIFMILFSTCSVSGCNHKNETAKTVNLNNIRLDKDLTISTKDVKKVVIGNFRGLAVDNDGKIYAADTKLQKVHIFSSHGNYLGSLGKKGRGPGEFFHLDANIQILADTLYIAQPVSQQVDLFNLKSRHHIKTIFLPVRPRELLPLTHGNLLVSYGTFYIHAPKKSDSPHFYTIATLNSSGDYIDKKILRFPMPFPSDNKVFYLKSGSMWVFKTSIFPAIKIATTPQGNLFIGKSDSLLIRKYNDKGKPLQKIEKTYEPASFSNADFDSMARKKGIHFKKAVNQMGVPTYWPAFQYFIIDDEGRCWVKLLNPGKAQQTWLVFGRRGNPKWKFKLPTEIDLYTIKHGNAYAIDNPPESISTIIRYKIHLGSSK